MQETWIQGGFVFPDKAMADQAAKEVDAVEYLRSRLEDAEPDIVYQMYQQIVQQNLFSTPVGYSYLKQLRDYLTLTAGYEESSVATIPVEMGISEKTSSETRQEDKDPSGRANSVLIGVNICLVIIVIAMFLISMTSDQTTILNYENQIIDKYEEWEQELDEREAELDAREE